MIQIGPYEVIYAFEGENDVIFLQTEDCAYGITEEHPLWMTYQESLKDEIEDDEGNTVPQTPLEMRPSRPTEFHDIWDGDQWVLNQERFTPHLRSQLSNYRESLEITIVTYGGHSSFCDKESVTGLDECIANIMDSGGSKLISWDGPNEYEPANLEALSGLRKEVVDYRQKTRDAERQTLEAHGDTPFTSLEDALSAFDGYMED